MAPACSSQPRCVTYWKVLLWCCVTQWWATWITPWCTIWSGDSLSSNSTSYTTCWRYAQMIRWHPLMFITLIILISKSTNHLLLLLCCQVADRLFSSFGQDILDALYWTATEPKEKKRAHIGVIPHFLMAVLYVCILTEKDVIFINSLFILLLLCASVLKFRRHRGQKSPLELRQWVGGK